MVPNLELFRDWIDICAIAIAVKDQFKLIIRSPQMFIADFPSHDMGSKGVLTKQNNGKQKNNSKHQ